MRKTGRWLLYVLLLIVVGLQVFTVFREGDRPATETAAQSDEIEATRSLAMKLEDRNLPDAAAQTWRRYLTLAGLDAPQEAAIRYRIGKLNQQARHYEDAVAELYRAEQLLGDRDADLSRQIVLRVRDCLRSLGQHADLSRDLAERAGAGDESTTLQGRQVVAQIGPEKITVADFDRMLTEQIEQTIALQPGISAEEAETFRQQAHARFTDPGLRTEQLQQMVASRVLADEARRGKLDETSAFRSRISDFADHLLATTLLLQEVDKRALVTPQDVERFYQANEGRYVEPATATIAHILCDTREAAAEVIAQAGDGADFAELAARYSLDQATRESGGLVKQPLIEDGEFVPDLGRQAALHAAAFAAASGSVLPEPYESDKGWHVVKVVQHRPRVQQALEEVRDRVEADARTARRGEVTDQYVRELFETHGVQLYPNAFTAVRGGKTDSDD